MVQRNWKSTISKYRSPGYRDRYNCLHLISVLVVCVAFSGAAYALEEDTHTHTKQDTAADSEQTGMANIMCPVMPEMEAKSDIFTDYEGKRVYFCCNNCRAAFIKNPEQYLPRLPQFASIAPHTGHEHGGHSLEATLARLVKPAGIITLSLLGLTVAAALFRRRSPRFLLKWHKRLGVTTAIFAAIHAVLVLIAH